MNDNRIVEYERYGMHIPLKCKNHPEKRWSTKNIDYIGARTIFYNLSRDKEMGMECDCKGQNLVPLTEDEYIEYLYKTGY